MLKGQPMPQHLKDLHSKNMKGRYEGVNNPFYGKKHSEETKSKMRGKGLKDKPKYGSLHDYIKYYKSKPKQCDLCNKRKKLDLTNISQQYKRDFDDWEWLCRRCHMIKDGRMYNLIKRNKGVVGD